MYTYETDETCLKVRDQENSVEMELEVLATGALFRERWRYCDLSQIDAIFGIMPSLVGETVKKTPDISYGTTSAECSFEIYIESKCRKILFVLPRVVVPDDTPGESDKIRTLSRRIRSLEEAYLISTQIPLSLISQTNENMIPATYLKISERFPHLTLPEIIAFEQKLRDSKGKIQTHSGKFVQSKRITREAWNHSDTPTYTDYIAWSCCHSACDRAHNKGVCMTYGNSPHYITDSITRQAMWPSPKLKYVAGSCCGSPGYVASPQCGNVNTTGCGRINGKLRQIDILNSGAPDLRNRSPIGQCDSPATYCLWEHDELTIDVAERKVRDAMTAIEQNIETYKHAVADLSERISHLTKIAEALKMIRLDV